MNWRSMSRGCLSKVHLSEEEGGESGLRVVPLHGGPEVWYPEHFFGERGSPTSSGEERSPRRGRLGIASCTRRRWRWRWSWGRRRELAYGLLLYFSLFFSTLVLHPLYSMIFDIYRASVLSFQLVVPCVIAWRTFLSSDFFLPAFSEKKKNVIVSCTWPLVIWQGLLDFDQGAQALINKASKWKWRIYIYFWIFLGYLDFL